MKPFGSIRWSPPQGGKTLGTLPVRIRDLDGTIVVEGLSGRPIDVPEGSYYVGALMPDGYEVVADEPVRVTAGGAVDAVLRGFAPELTVTAAAAPPQMAGDAAPMRRLAARLWSGDLLQHLDTAAAAPDGGEEIALEALHALTINRRFGEDEALLVEHDGTRTIHVLPLDECVACVGEPEEARAIAVTAVEGSAGLDLRFTSPISEDTNAFIEFIDHGLLSESRAISTDLVMRGEQAMMEPQASLLRAVLGAYVLLRANECEGLDAWIEQLILAAPEMPDAYALQAETLARLGEHEGAVDALRRSLDRPCPWFRSGVSYLLERFRLYLDVHGEPSVKFQLAERDLKRFADRKRALERAATHLDTRKVFTTFTA